MPNELYLKISINILKNGIKWKIVILEYLEQESFNLVLLCGRNTNKFEFVITKRETKHSSILHLIPLAATWYK